MSNSEAACLREWMDCYGPRLQSVARALARDADEADDLLQEMWVVALRRRHTLRPDAAVGAWLYRILMNIGRARARTTARRNGLLRRWWGGAQVAQGPELPVHGANERMRSLLWREIAELPDLQRQVLLLRVVEEMSTAETARAIDRAEGTVKASLHRAMKRLERRLGQLGVDLSSLKEE